MSMHTCTDKGDRTIEYHLKVEHWRQCHVSVFAKLGISDRRQRNKIDGKGNRTILFGFHSKQNMFLYQQESR